MVFQIAFFVVRKIIDTVLLTVAVGVEPLVGIIEQRTARVLLLEAFIAFERLPERGGIFKGEAFGTELVALLQPEPFIRA